ARRSLGASRSSRTARSRRSPGKKRVAASPRTMSLPARLLPLAAEEGRSARLWYGARDPEAGARFLGELDRALAAVSETPHRLQPYLHGTQRLHLRRFPYWIIYRIERRAPMNRTPHAGYLSRLLKSGATFTMTFAR